MKLTRKQAFELSIRKWEALAKGQPIPDDIEEMDLDGGCGFCEKYRLIKNKKLSFCAKCPIRPKILDYDKLFEMGCLQSVHPFSTWAMTHRSRTAENAQKVLDLIIASQNKRRR